MKPAPFDYHTPETAQQAIELLNQLGADAQLLAGGQSLIPAMNFRAVKPTALIDLNNIPSLQGVRAEDDGSLHIGAMTRYRTLETDPLVYKRQPLIHAAVPFIAHPAIRSRGTIGGSLAFADPAAELPTVVITLGATLHLHSVQGARSLPADQFFVDLSTTRLAADEMLTEIEIPPMQAGAGWGFRESARRHGDRVMMGVAALVNLDQGGCIASARVALMNAGPTPMLARHACADMIGKTPSDELARHAAGVAARLDIDPPDDTHASAAFRRNLAETLTLRTLLDAFTRATK